MTEKVEPVAYMHPIGAIWRLDNYPAGMDFATDGWVPLVPLDTLTTLQAKNAELEARLATAYTVKAEMNDLANEERRQRNAAESKVASLTKRVEQAETERDSLVAQFDHSGCTCTFPSNDCCAFARATRSAS